MTNIINQEEQNMAISFPTSSPLPSSIIISLLILVSISCFSPIAMGARPMPTTLPSWVLEIIAVAVRKGSSPLSTVINAIQFVGHVCNETSSSDNLEETVLEEITPEITKSGSFARDARQAVCEQLRERIPNNGAGGTGQVFPSHRLILMQLAIGLIVTLAPYYS